MLTDQKRFQTKNNVNWDSESGPSFSELTAQTARKLQAVTQPSLLAT